MDLYEILSPGGRECAMTEFIKAKAEKLGYACKTDVFGNLICQRGSGAKITFECGADTVCFMKTAETDGGMIKIAVPKSSDVASLIGKKVKFLNGVTGFVRCSKTEKPEDFDLSVDIGETDRESAAEKVPTGEFGSVLCDMTETDKFIFGNGLSSYAPVAVMLEVMENISHSGISFVFTAQKRFAGRGIKALLGDYETDYFVSVDTISEKGEIKCGGGAAVIIKDKTGVLNVDVRKALISSAGGDVQIAATDDNMYLDLPQICGKGTLSGCVCLAIRDKNKSYEGCAKSDIKSAAAMLLKFAKEVR